MTYRRVTLSRTDQITKRGYVTLQMCLRTKMFIAPVCYPWESLGASWGDSGGVISTTEQRGVPPLTVRVL